MKNSTDSAVKSLVLEMGDTMPCPPIKFAEYLDRESEHPERMLRNVFQFFYGAIKHYLGEGTDEYPDEESIGYRNYDSAKLFEDGFDDPFFADRLFTNRLVSFAGKLRGIQNRIMIFVGPPGSGKSTFLKNLLQKAEIYSRSIDGSLYELVWKIDRRSLAATTKQELECACPDSEEKLMVACPSHDHPLLIIPPEFRRNFLHQLIKDKRFVNKLESEREYRWLFSERACTICTSIFNTLLEKFGNVEKVLAMAYARRYFFDRRFGQGVTVFNPGDNSPRMQFFANDSTQESINKVFGGDGTTIRYIYSHLANTNRGIYCLMDVKGENRDRFVRLHNIVTDGKLKVSGLLEEDISTLFIAIMNPEDQKVTDEMASFRDRITEVKIPYVLVPETEMRVYTNLARKEAKGCFLPGLIKIFATAVISSRMKPGSEAIKKWLGDIKKYRKYCDEDSMMLKMSLYGGTIPAWLSDEDKRKFTREIREAIVRESEEDGSFGFSGRDSIRLFNEFLARFCNDGRLSTINDVISFFKNHEWQRGNQKRESGKEVDPYIPNGFTETLLRVYKYQVKRQIKESLFNYNEQQISKDVVHYMVAINHELDGTTIKCPYTEEKIDLTENFVRRIEDHLLGVKISEQMRSASRKSFQKDFVSRTLQEIMSGKNIMETDLFKGLREQYIVSLRKDILEPLKNPTFRMALKSYNTEEFKNYDKRTREDIEFLLENLKNKFDYTEEGGVYICLWYIDNVLS